MQETLRSLRFGSQGGKLTKTASDLDTSSSENYINCPGFLHLLLYKSLFWKWSWAFLPWSWRVKSLISKNNVVEFNDVEVDEVLIHRNPKKTPIKSTKKGWKGVGKGGKQGNDLFFFAIKTWKNTMPSALTRQKSLFRQRHRGKNVVCWANTLLNQDFISRIPPCHLESD